MKRKSFADMTCPIAQALDVVGEWWTLLIIRDALLMGSTRFEEFQDSLGISTNVLTARLGRLVEEEILERRRYQDRPPRYEYKLTPKGRGLWPVIMDLQHWGHRWTPVRRPSPRMLFHTECQHEMQPEIRCSNCGDLLTSETAQVALRIG